MKKIMLALVFLSGMAAICAFAIVFSLHQSVLHEDATFVVNRGAPMGLVAEQLGRAGVIRHPLLFIIYARAMRVDRKIKAGEYVFVNGLSAIDVLKKLRTGDCRLYRITLIEGWTLRQVADYLSNQPFASSEFASRFISAAADRYFLRSLGIIADSAEGYMFPDTYFIPRPVNAEWLIMMLADAFNRAYPPAFDARAGELKMSRGEIVALASIIEKEAGNDLEKPIVSSVFHNRLRKGIPLQADPTVIYGLKDFNGNIRKADLSNSHPYNTYVHKGLPPGPIANPGLLSIKAALWPAETEYLYFVSRNNGTHEFSKTYTEHAKAVAKYQIGH